MTRMIALLTSSIFAAIAAIVPAEAAPGAKNNDAVSATEKGLRTLSRVMRDADGTTSFETGQGATTSEQLAEAGHVHDDGPPHNEDETAADRKPESKTIKSDTPSDHKRKEGHEHGEHGHNGPKGKTQKAAREIGGNSKKQHDHGNEKTANGDGEHGSADDGTDDSDHEEHDEGVTLNKQQMREFGVRTIKVGPGSVSMMISRPAEVKFNENLVAHVVPRVSGIVDSVGIAEGETVREGQVIALLDSRELAEAKAAYLAALERHTLAQENYEREESLQRKKITSEKSLSTSKTILAEARIAMRSAEQKLHALDFDQESLKQLSTSATAALTRYTMRAPLSGIVIERHLVRGESVGTDTKAFTIADPSTVWVDISIYSRDLQHVRAGQTVLTKIDDGIEVTGKIEFVSPHVSESTRTAKARLVLDNRNSMLKPGQFAKAEIAISQTAAAVRVPKSALQNQDGKPVVFVADAGAFKARLVEIGHQDSTYAEVVSGLKAGEIVVVDGSFVIKSQLSKASFGDGHNH